MRHEWSQTQRVLEALQADQRLSWSSSAYQLSYAPGIPAPSVRGAINELRKGGHIIVSSNGAYRLEGE